MTLYTTITGTAEDNRQAIIRSLYEQGSLQKGQELKLQPGDDGRIEVLAPDGRPVGVLPEQTAKSLQVFHTMGYAFTSYTEDVSAETTGFGKKLYKINIRIINTSIPEEAPVKRTRAQLVRDMVRTTQESSAAAPKPADEKLVRLVCNILREECTGNPYGATVTFLANEADTTEEQVVSILKHAKWAKFQYGRYTFCPEFCDIPAPEQDAPSLIHVYSVDETADDEELQKAKKATFQRLEELYRKNVLGEQTEEP